MDTGKFVHPLEVRDDVVVVLSVTHLRDTQVVDQLGLGEQFRAWPIVAVGAGQDRRVWDVMLRVHVAVTRGLV